MRKALRQKRIGVPPGSGGDMQSSGKRLLWTSHEVSPNDEFSCVKTCVTCNFNFCKRSN